MARPISTKLYPFQGTARKDGIHYLDVGKGEPILLIHGTPSWSFEWRNVIAGLQTGYRCIAPDLEGFGLSNKHGNADYPIQFHAEKIESLVVDLDLKGLTLVAHDFGGPIALDFATRQKDRIKRIILINTWCVDPQRIPAFRKGVRILKSPLTPFLYLYLNFSPRFLLPRAFSRGYKLEAEILRHYCLPFPDAKSRAGTLAFARNLISDGKYFDDVRHRLIELSGKPIHLLWGEGDPLLPKELVDDWKEAVPDIKVSFCSAGHFVAEEMPEVVIQTILQR